LAARALAGDITVGSLFALISYVLMLNAPVQRLGFLVNLAATAGASAKRVFDIIDTPSEIESNARRCYRAGTCAGTVTFEGSTLPTATGRFWPTFPFHAEPGQTVALIGPTGSGKSTVTNLIPRFYDATQKAGTGRWRGRARRCR
jgi:ABC-type multidrug transport system fused ATPase/permease subunit